MSILQKLVTANRTADVEVAGQTKDSIYATFLITITYRIDGANAGKFFRITNSTDISREQLNSVVKASLQANTIVFDIYGILGGDLENLRLAFFADIEKVLLENYFISLVNISFNDIDAGERIEQIIQNKAEAMQQVEIAEQEKQRAIIEAETARIRAENDAAIELLKAKATAEAEELLQAVAVSAIKKMYSSQFESDIEKTNFEETGKGGFLTIQEIGEIVVKQLYYDTWDGQLPSVVTDGTDGIIIQP